jgi:hypothetical protein
MPHNLAREPARFFTPYLLTERHDPLPQFLGLTIQATDNALHGFTAADSKQATPQRLVALE